MEGFSGQMPFLLLMLVVFFFFIILPQQRRQKKEKNFMKNLAKGDRVITKSGIHAKMMNLMTKTTPVLLRLLQENSKLNARHCHWRSASKIKHRQKIIQSRSGGIFYKQNDVSLSAQIHTFSR